MPEHAAAGHRRVLLLSLAINAAFFVVEAAVGYVTDSLVLLADAGHMLTDVAALGFALLAIWFAARPATAHKTFGYYRLEILAALVNSLLLFGVAGAILYEAAGRLSNPPGVPSVPVIAVAAVGLFANLLPALLLMKGAKESLAVKSAFLDMLGDALASVGAIAAGLIILTTGWQYADPLLAVLVAFMILPRTWKLLRESVDVLLEATPRGLDLTSLEASILGVPGVVALHDLHAWTVTSGFIALSAHVQVGEQASRDGILEDIRRLLHDEFDVTHATLQVEAHEGTGGEKGCIAGDACYAPGAAPLRPQHTGRR